MNCPQCRFDNPKGMAFCGQCGSRLEKTCPKCHTAMPPEFKFCGSCGYLLSAAMTGSEPAYPQPKTYTPSHLARKILTNRSAIEGERKRVTVLFADVANYTAMAARMDPEAVHRMMDDCFQILMDAVHRYEGTINQFIGDGVMALFGAPVAHEDHAQRACHAALAIQQALTLFSDKIYSRIGCEFKMRIGINSGPVVVGAIGDDLRMDYTAIGDTTNLAARLESLAVPGTILVSRRTYKQVKAFFEFKSMASVKIKGRKGLHQPWQLVDTSQVVSRIEASTLRGLSRFSGRDHETQILLDAYEKVRFGSGQLVGLVGEAGVGKSRLLIEFCRLLPEGRFLTLEGRCLPYGAAIAYLPWQEIIKRYFDLKESDRKASLNQALAAKLNAAHLQRKDFLAPFQELLSLKPDDENYLGLDPQKRREKIFEALKDLLVHISQKNPLVLIIEDLHWIDKTSEEFLDFFIPWLPITPVLLIISYRSEYSHPWGSKSYYTNLSLDHLHPKDSASLIASILSGKKVAGTVQSFILSRAGGNPLFLEEMTHTLIENDLIEESDHTYQIKPHHLKLKVPDTIQGIISSRIDRLDDVRKRTVQIAAVIGRDFAYRILQTITGMRTRLKTTLQDLQRSEFIYAKRMLPELEYFFKHALTQEVAYNSILQSNRQDIHERIGDTIEDLYAERLEEFYEVLGYHYSRSRNTAKAIKYLLLSGDKCTHKHSLWEAFRFYHEAIGFIKKGTPSDESRRLHLRALQQMSIPMRLLGYPKESLTLLLEGQRLAESVGDNRHLSRLYSVIGHCYAMTGDPAEAIRYSENSLAEARKIGDVNLIAPIACDLSTAYQSAGDHDKVVRLIPWVLELIVEADKKEEFFGKPFNVYSGLHVYYGFSKVILGEFEAGKRLFDSGLQFAQQIDDLCAIALIELGYGHLYNIRSQGRQAIKHFQNCIRSAEKVEYFSILGLAYTSLGWGQYLTGQKDSAVVNIDKGMRLQLESGTQFHQSLPYWYLGCLYFNENDLEQAKANIDRALTLALENHQRLYEGLSWALQGRIIGRLRPGCRQEAEAALLKGKQILEDLQSKTYMALVYALTGEFYAEMEEFASAAKFLQKASRMYSAIDMPVEAERAQALWERLPDTK